MSRVGHTPYVTETVRKHMRKKELQAHRRVGCVELVQVFDERKGVAAFAVRARCARRLGRLRKTWRKRFWAERMLCGSLAGQTLQGSLQNFSGQAG